MQRNVDPEELARFAHMAPRWWDPHGESQALHDLNPVRLRYVREQAEIRGRRVLDVGCGGGLLSEALAGAGAQVTAIDAEPSVLAVAKLHAAESGMTVDYRLSDAETLATQQPAEYDVVTCMEMLEHVPDFGSVVAACARLLRPGGHAVFSTINRTPKAFLLAIVGAEYVAGLLPKGTHRYEKLIRPSELAQACRHAGLLVRDVRGLAYNPLFRRASLVENTGVNYLLSAQRPA